MKVSYLHLTWADWRWWTSRSESHGFAREHEIERALHSRWGDYTSADRRRA